MSRIQWACQNGDMDQLETLIEAGEDVNQELSQGRRPLHIAADYGQMEVIRKLTEKGADVNAIDKNGISVLLAAIFEGHTECVDFLLQKGAKKEGKFNGETYFELAEKDEIKELLK
ncbi:myotrophin-like [Acanthaster planci]|uniref:Myotrophin-like n=1 Tax=Acanthaster planci TaxID=133434 RepID=A0A8B7XRL3_ACAPL|nr:myotrophin-like [Acanthaster planci]